MGELNSKLARAKITSIKEDVQMEDVDVKIDYTVDLLSIVGDGRFPCPRCSTIFDPDDYTETTYDLVNVEYSGDKITEMTIVCLRCKAKIRIIGFNNMPR